VAHTRREINKLVGLAGVMALGLILAACSSVAPGVGTVNSVSIDQGGSTTMNAGSTLNLTVTVKVSNGAAKTVTWKSSDTSVATVDNSGTVTAVASGTANITATSTVDPGKSASIAITVASTTVNPNDIYVDASAPSGGNGSSANPFQTIAAGVNAVNAGGTVHVAAGTYNEALDFNKALDLEGAGASSTTITTSSAATSGGSSSGDAMAVNGVSGLTLAGFTLSVQSPDSTLTNAALAAYSASGNLTIKDVTITTPGSANLAGLALDGVQTGTITNVTVTDQAGSSGGPGVLIDGDSTGVTLAGLTVNGHSGYAGIVLSPGSGTISNTTITNATLNLINKMEVNLGSGGLSGVTGLNAPQFTDVVRSTNAGYGANNELFYKTSQSDALADSLFNFGSVQSQSYIQQVSGTDKAQLGDFVVGAIQGTKYSSTAYRANSLQTAIDQASAGDTIHVLSSLSTTFDGAITVSKSLTISGVGGASKITAPSGTPVITVTANNVTLSGLDLNSTDNGSAAVQVDSGTVSGLAIHSSNFMSATGLDDTATAPANAVSATNDYWNASNGPSGTGLSGSGSAIVDPGGNVTSSPYATTAF